MMAVAREVIWAISYAMAMMIICLMALDVSRPMFLLVTPFAAWLLFVFVFQCFTFQPEESKGPNP